MTDLLTAENLGRLVIVLMVALAAVWTDRAITGREGNTTDSMQVRFVQRVMRPADIVEPTEPETATRYEAPDSQDTRQDCVTIPIWMDTLKASQGSLTRSEASQLSVDRQADSVRERSRLQNTASTHTNGLANLAGLPYVITPTTNGRPHLSVTSQTATLSAIDPRTGAGIEYSYDVPRPDWRITAGGGLTAGSGYGLGLSTIGIGHRTPIGWMSLRGGYGGVVTDQIRSGFVGQITIRKTLYSWGD